MSMMSGDVDLQEIEKRRHHLISELVSIRSLVRGSLSEQFLKVSQKGKKEPVLCGPYYVLSRSVKGRTKSERVKKKDVERVKQEVANHQRFARLCEELAQVTEQLGALQREASASEETLKKGLKSR